MGLLRTVYLFLGLAGAVLVTWAVESVPPNVAASASSLAAAVPTPVLSGPTHPVFVTHAGDGSDRLFIVEQGGTIRIAEAGTLRATPFLNVSGLITAAGSEQGLLGLAFHPSYSTNCYFYVMYTASNGANTVARFQTRSDTPYLADVNSQQILFSIPDSRDNHNGGMLAFGPDGYLYVGTGDGGGGGDPDNNAPNLDVLLGKLLRLDVDHGAPSAYAIPPSNPFVGVPGARGEVWALGLRNPWRFSFDRATGDLYIGDVGQNVYEEVDVHPVASPGGQNYGWSCYEGLHTYDTSRTCTVGALTPPVYEYPHNPECSITGGYVYRGPSSPALVGKYVFGDYCSGKIWSLTNNGGAWSATFLTNNGSQLSSFGEDRTGELYVVYLSGSIYRLCDLLGTCGAPAATATPTPTATRTSTATLIPTTTRTPTLTPGGSFAVPGNALLQGRPTPVSERQRARLQVTFYHSGLSTVAYTATPTSDERGDFTITGAPFGNYDVRVKQAQSLSRQQNQVTVGSGSVNLHFGTLTTGDADGNDVIDIRDFSQLRAQFNTSTSCAQTTAPTMPCADLDASGQIDIVDFSLLRGGFGQAGAQLVS